MFKHDELSIAISQRVTWSVSIHGQALSKFKKNSYTIIWKAPSSEVNADGDEQTHTL